MRTESPRSVAETVDRLTLDVDGNPTVGVCQQCDGPAHICELPDSTCRFKATAREWLEEENISSQYEERQRSIARMLRHTEDAAWERLSVARTKELDWLRAEIERLKSEGDGLSAKLQACLVVANRPTDEFRIAELERERDEARRHIAEWGAQVDQLHHDVENAVGERDEARAEVERLRVTLLAIKTERRPPFLPTSSACGWCDLGSRGHREGCPGKMIDEALEKAP